MKPEQIASSTLNQNDSGQVEEVVINTEKENNSDKNIKEKIPDVSILELKNNEDGIQWNNLKFYLHSTADNYVDQLYAINTLTGEKQIIYDINTTKDFEGYSPKPDAINDVIIINKTLYFSVGGYLRPSALYYLDLPPEKNELTLFIREGNKSVKYKYGKIWIYGGFGDGCIFSESYEPFDITRKTRNPEIIVNMDCENGTRLVGVNNKGAIIGEFEKDKNTNSSFSQNVKLVDIYYASIIPHGMHTYILTSENMPDNITLVEFMENENRLKLINKNDNKIYIFDLNLNKFI